VQAQPPTHGRTFFCTFSSSRLDMESPNVFTTAVSVRTEFGAMSLTSM
jgi:hypothetical protein